MNCEEARPLIDASVDRELHAADEWRLHEHLAGCVRCEREAEVVRSVSRAARSAPTYYRAPEGLGARIVAALPAVVSEDVAARAVDEGARAPLRVKRWRGWPLPRFGGFGAFGSGSGAGARIGVGWLAGAMLALGALGIVAALSLREPVAGGEFVDELVSSHVRSMISGRDIDVVSSDRHTVKPWFNGKIDYAPPVEDLAAAGYPLVGGRVDYVGHERVAVLVYRSGRHVIDVYIFPPGDAGLAASRAAPAPASDGYAIERWRAGGMTLWAISDAQAAALSGLRAALDARLAGR